MRVNYLGTSTIYTPSFASPNNIITNNNNYLNPYTNVNNSNNKGYQFQFINNNNNIYLNLNNIIIGNRTNQPQFNINNNPYKTSSYNNSIYYPSIQNNINNINKSPPNYLNLGKSIMDINSVKNIQNNNFISNNNQNIVNNHSAPSSNYNINIIERINSDGINIKRQTSFNPNNTNINYLRQNIITNRNNNNNEIYLTNNNVNQPIQYLSQYPQVVNNPTNNYLNNGNYLNNVNNIYKTNSSNQQLIDVKNDIKFNQLVKPRGLDNVGATCYMNATLQCFYHVKLLSENIINDNNITTNTKLTFCYKDLVEQLAGCKNRQNYLLINGPNVQNTFVQRLYSVKPIKFKDIISEMNILFKGIKANDSKDLILFLLETMDTELTKRNNNIQEMELFFGTSKEELLPQNFKKYHNSIICDIFYGFQSMKIKCNGCNDIKTTYSVINIFNFALEKIYNDLKKEKNQNNNFNNIYKWYFDYNNMNNNNNKYNLTNPEFNKNLEKCSTLYKEQGKKLNNIKIPEPNRKLNLYDCFKNNNRIEYLTGDNKIFCEKCQKLCDGIMKYNLYQPPNVLIILLNRGKGNEFKCDVDFPKELNLKDYVEECTSDKIYDLIGVICHIGKSSMEGHFIAYCKHFDNKWYLFNDSFVSSHQENGIYNGTPYILFYQNMDLKG